MAQMQDFLIQELGVVGHISAASLYSIHDKTRTDELNTSYKNTQRG